MREDELATMESSLDTISDPDAPLTPSFFSTVLRTPLSYPFLLLALARISFRFAISSSDFLLLASECLESDDLSLLVRDVQMLNQENQALHKTRESLDKALTTNKDIIEDGEERLQKASEEVRRVCVREDQMRRKALSADELCETSSEYSAATFGKPD